MKIEWETPPYTPKVVLTLSRDEVLHVWQALGMTSDGARRRSIGRNGCRLLSDDINTSYWMFNKLGEWCRKHYAK